ncbi:swi5-dependent recombination DNA repair protein 1 homolog [Myripristis murdjan]|uniref:swi5-dependent recombination DNA repair protein 1 homolog n=1 Tax=Myripristis murdjan TaxID=586833 RepID=UPI0011764621|nr:swi5-dependent recombination DNA repair protein 1 homolog [Myripristis murdjan]
MNDSGKCSGQTMPLDLDFDRRNAKSDDLEEDKEIAHQAVLLVMSGTKRGAVHLCARVADLMRENRSLQQTIEAQKALIRRLRSLCFLAHSPDDPASPEPPSQPQTSSSSPSPRLPPLPQSGFNLLSPSLSPPPPASSSSFYLPSPSASSCSSGRGSLSSTTTPPFLPHLTETPHPHPPISLCNHQALSVPCTEGNKLPIIPHPPSTRQRSNAVRKPGGRRTISSGYGATSSKTQRILKKRGCLQRTTLCGNPLREDKEDSKEEDDKDEALEEATLSQGEVLHPSSIRRKHHLNVNEQVAVETRKEKEEEWAERGEVVKFTGPQWATDSTDVNISVEQNIPCGENDSCLGGSRYFNCGHSQGEFTVIKDVRKLSSNSAPPTGRHALDPSPSSQGGDLPKKLLVVSEEGQSDCRNEHSEQGCNSDEGGERSEKRSC